MRKFQIFTALLLTVVLLAACNRSSEPFNQAGGMPDTQGAVENTMEQNSTENASIEGTSSQEPEGSTEEGSTQEIGTEETGTGEKDEVPSIPEFLSAIADEVILDEAEFTVWGDLIDFVIPYTKQGFIPCELVVEGERCRGLYMEDGLVIVEKRTAEYDYIFAKNSEKLQLELGGLPLYGDALWFNFYDMDGDGSDELLIDGHTGKDGAVVCHVVRLDTMTEIPIALDRAEDYFSYYVPEIVLTEIIKISDTNVRFSYAATDKNGIRYEGYSYVYANSLTKEEYELWPTRITSMTCRHISEENPTLLTLDGRIRCLAYMEYKAVNNIPIDPRAFTTLEIYLEYDSVTDSFQPVKVLLSLGSEEKGGEEQWVEIDIK